MTPSLLFLILITVSLSALAQISFKTGVSAPGFQASLAAGWHTSLLSGLINPYVILGLAVYVISTLLWLMVLARLDVTVAYPFVGLGFVMIMIFGFFVLHEPVGLLRISGALLVAAGVALIARS